MTKQDIFYNTEHLQCMVTKIGNFTKNLPTKSFIFPLGKPEPVKIRTLYKMFTDMCKLYSLLCLSHVAIYKPF